MACKWDSEESLKDDTCNPERADELFHAACMFLYTFLGVRVYNFLFDLFV